MDSNEEEEENEGEPSATSNSDPAKSREIRKNRESGEMRKEEKKESERMCRK